MPSYHLFPHGAFQAVWNLYGAQDGKKPLQYERDYVAIKSDGGTVSIDWAYPPERHTHDFNNESQKVCIVFPGLSGHS